MRRILPAISLVAAGALAQADPLPVHAAALGIDHTHAARSDRLALAGVSPSVQVLSATQTAARENALEWNMTTCDQPRCAPQITNPLHGMGMILV